MKYINSIFEHTWWTEKIEDHDFQEQNIMDILYDLQDYEYYTIRIEKTFMNNKFKSLSKKVDTLTSNFYCAYNITCRPTKHIKIIKDYINRNKLMNDALIILDRYYHCSVSNYGDTISIICIDLDTPFNTNGLVDKKKRNIEKSLIDSVYDKVKLHHKIFDASLVNNGIEIIKKNIDIEKAIEILNNMFTKEIENNSIEISHDDYKIFILFK